ncbi:MAG: MopE-related protein [Myxococcota bacterium]
MRVSSLFTSAAFLLAILACAGEDTATTDEEAENDPGLLEDQDKDDDGFVFSKDCNDDNADIHPDAEEKCDPADVDEDCNGVADSADIGSTGSVSAFHDADLDGYGDPTNPISVCELSSGYVGDNTDCDDTDPVINPGVVEICDYADVDEDCNGSSDDDDRDVAESSFLSFYEDTDGDGFGRGGAEGACDASAGYADNSEDCDDDDSATNPDALEVWYDGVDADCSGGSDFDQDRDTYDAESYGGDDCDDRANAVYPGARDEWYDGVNADCSSGSDFDADGDGQESDEWGGNDCDDSDDDVYYGAYESGSVDSNCDGVVRAMPFADADYDTRRSTLDTCEAIYLIGTGSSDPAGLALTYAWALVSAPTSSIQTTDDIRDYDDVSPTFSPWIAGDYTFELVVTNGISVASYPDDLTVTIADRATNTAPVARAGSDQTAEQEVTCDGDAYTAVCEDCADATFVLDATGSTDADGDGLQYTWLVTSGTGSFSSASGETTVLTIPGGTTTSGDSTATAVIVTVTATDCYGESSTDTITLVSECTGT